MGSSAGALLVALGFAVPLIAAFALVWSQERRQSFMRLKFGRLSQDNRGLKLALNAAPTGALPLTFATDAERQEFLELAGTLAANGTLIDWLRMGTRPPLDAGARLLGVNEKDAVALRQAVGDWTAQGILAVLDRLKARFIHIADMERVWTASANEVNLRPVIDQAMWVFEPEIVVSDSGQAVSSTATLARAVTDLSLDPARAGQEAGGKLLVELRDVRATVGAEDQLQAWSDVRELMKAGAIRERDPVDVYVIGGSVDGLDGNPRVEGRHRNVRITSCDYGQVIGRAKRLTLGLYDDLHEAPFLRQYRADAAAAVQAEAERVRLAQQRLEQEAAEREEAERRATYEARAAHDDGHEGAVHDDHAHDAHAHEDQAHDDHAHDDQAHDGQAHDGHSHDEHAGAHAGDAHAHGDETPDGHHDDHEVVGPHSVLHAQDQDAHEPEPAPPPKPAAPSISPFRSRRFRNAAQ